MVTSSAAPTPADSSDSPLRIHFVGTGTSTALPVGPCLAEAAKPSRDVAGFLEDYTAAPEDDRDPALWGGYEPGGKWPASVACASCHAAVDPTIDEGWKNRRGNPGLVLRKRVPKPVNGANGSNGPNGVSGSSGTTDNANSDDEWRNIVVDVGKTFREQSCRFFPRWGIRRIDAVLITHGHADAYNGLDDLREWCGRQGAAIPVYLDQTTFDTVAASFPYLVDKTKASGGGDLPSLDFRIIPDETEFEIEGITVTTIPVYHGYYFHAPAATEPAVPSVSEPQTRAVTPATSAPPTSAPAAEVPGAYGPKPIPSSTPFVCLGFVFDRQVVYLSDVSTVPAGQWARIEASLRPEYGFGTTPTAAVTANSATPTASAGTTTANSTSTTTTTPNPATLPLLIVDVLWPWRTHASHISFSEAMAIAMRLRAQRTYFLGMTHPTTHYQWEELGRVIRGEEAKESKGKPDPSRPDARLSTRLVDRVFSGPEIDQTEAGPGLAKRLREWGGFVEPAYDGLGLEVSRDRCDVLPWGEGSTGGWGI